MSVAAFSLGSPGRREKKELKKEANPSRTVERRQTQTHRQQQSRKKRRPQNISQIYFFRLFSSSIKTREEKGGKSQVFTTPPLCKTVFLSAKKSSFLLLLALSFCSAGRSSPYFPRGLRAGLSLSLHFYVLALPSSPSFGIGIRSFSLGKSWPCHHTLICLRFYKNLFGRGDLRIKDCCCYSTLQ